MYDVWYSVVVAGKTRGPVCNRLANHSGLKAKK